MALTTYETRTQRLLQNPAAPTPLYSTSLIDDAINQARNQIAGESESIRAIGTVTATVGVQNYNFSSISTGVNATTGIGGVIHARRLSYNVGQNQQGFVGQQWVPAHPWEWFDLYYLNNPVPDTGPPKVWAQYGQGAASGDGTLVPVAAGGSFYVAPIPDFAYGFNLDCVCYPIKLTDNSTIEALPYFWTDCVPFLAAYWVLLSSQTQARMADAERYFGYYQTFLERARTFANPSVNRHMYEQSVDPASVNKLGIVNQAKGGG